jgi:hypothetical protein
MGGARLSYGPHDGKRECALHERRLRSLCWMGGSAPRQLFIIHAKEGWTKTSVVVEINTSTYASTNITFFPSIEGTVQILLLILGNENFINHMLHITYLHFIVVSFWVFISFTFFFFVFMKVNLKGSI